MVDGMNNLNSMRVTQTGVPATGAGQGGEVPEGGAGGASFKDVLMQNLNEVNKLQQESDTALENYVTGKSHNVGEVITASQKAGLAFSMLTQIRNKLQEAYDEVKNLRI
jgi:flagellar hook-basal body complex protein FliE